MAINNVIMSHQFRLEGYTANIWMHCIQTVIKERIEFQGFPAEVIEEIDLEQNTDEPLYIEVTDLTGEVVEEGEFEDMPEELLEILPKCWLSQFVQECEEVHSWPV